ncbi:serine hydrolase [Steroidobacter sp.]|uniref:serine hydrolase n=1 Tax=Steroidobacter sp. TaxID=1978227 RepID=UPI001A616760|nr:serine hydrolase [Steroidobacter sp.]MBL8266723.1 serine hydrolase [Steroidobacter sp.]
MMWRSQRRWLFALVLVFAGAAAQAFDAGQIYGYLQRLQTDSGAPGVSAAVAVNGEIVFSGGYGIADLQSGMPQNGRSVHNIGSISKTQAVVAVMQLVERGKLDLDAPVQTWAPWFPKKQKPITLRMVLTHTSGIRHYKDGEFGPAEVLSFRQYDNIEESTRFWRDDPLMFEPGKYWMYSSFATNLLHAVVEAASGQGFEDYLRKNVWQPAGMVDTQFDVPARIVARRGKGYELNRKSGQWENAQDENVSYKYAGGGMISTDEDLLRFASALNAGKLLNAKSLAEMYRLQLAPDIQTPPEEGKSQRKPSPSRGLSQALIWRVGKDASGRAYAGHSGAVKGTGSMLLNYRDQNVVVALHINGDSGKVSVESAADALAQMFLPAGAQVSQANRFDVLIKGGTIVDGSGKARFKADLGITGDTIVAVGDLSGAGAARTIDAAGKIVTPGFIDLHAHTADVDDGLLSKDPRRRAAQNYVAQGVTTTLSNPDGYQAHTADDKVIPLYEQRQALAAAGIGINVALTNGHNALREQVMTGDMKRPANAAEIRQMQEILRQDMASQGSFGLSLGVEYFSARYSDLNEEVELARVAAEYNGIFIPHLRSQGISPMWYRPSIDGDSPPTLDDSIAETLAVAEQTGVTAVFTHMKAWGPGYRGQAQKIVDRLQAARDRGSKIYMDIYPYDSSGSDGTFVALPDWAISSGQRPKQGEKADYAATLTETLKKADAKRRNDLARDVKHQLALKGGPENVRILEYPNAKYVGKSYAELMKMRKLDEVALAIALQKEGNPSWRGGAKMRSFSMAEEDIAAFYKPDWAATSTDGWVVLPEEAVGDKKYENTNRRCFGSYPRRLAYYSQQLGVDTLEHAVRSASGLPAEILRIQDRGRIAAGMKADVVVLDLATLKDNTTFLEPNEYPSGIDHVLVNGRAAVDGGKRTLTLSGRVLSASPRT